MQLKIFDRNGKQLNKTVKLDDTIFKAGINDYLMNLAALVYLGNQRQSNAHTKNRAEVRGGGAKPWRQKGTGRARHGSIRSPIWKGGGVVFGPRNERKYKRKITKKMRKSAIRSAFSFFTKEKRLIVIEKFELLDEHLTKQLKMLTSKLPVDKKILYIHKGDNHKLYLASRNLQNINVVSVDEVNVYELLKHDFIIVIENALEKINKYWGKDKIRKRSIQKKGDSKEVRVNKKSSRDLGIKALKLTSRVNNILEKEKIDTVNKLRKIVEKGEKIPGIGEKSLSDIKKAIEK